MKSILIWLRPFQFFFVSLPCSWFIIWLEIVDTKKPFVLELLLLCWYLESFYFEQSASNLSSSEVPPLTQWTQIFVFFVKHIFAGLYAFIHWPFQLLNDCWSTKRRAWYESPPPTLFVTIHLNTIVAPWLRMRNTVVSIYQSWQSVDRFGLFAESLMQKSSRKTPLSVLSVYMSTVVNIKKPLPTI